MATIHERTNLSVFKEIRNAMDMVNPKIAKVYIPWLMKHPRYLRRALPMLKQFHQCEQIRQNHLKQGVMVPPILILSITSRCNLNCAGCFAAVVGTKVSSSDLDSRLPLDFDQWKGILTDTSEMGVYTYLIAGGEPLLFPRLIELCQLFPNQLFVIFSNGTLLTPPMLDRLAKSTNIVVVVSIEGNRLQTDDRRGVGVYERVSGGIGLLKKRGIPCGISVTLTRSNASFWMEDSSVDQIIEMGAQMGVFIEYIPVSSPLTQSMGIQKQEILHPDERIAFRKKLLEYRASKPMFFIHSPGDEEAFGGCVSAARGFAHITPYGDVTPCPVSNVATHNLTTASFQQALQSPLFTMIRENESLLENTDGPCALFAHQEELDRLVDQIGAYRTGAD